MDLAHSGLEFFKPRVATATRQQPGARIEVEARLEKRLFCGLCRHPVTHQDERIPVDGRDEHRCTNPAGYTFRIWCFREAGGCVATGAPTTAHTWFKGYAWQIALCAACERHLGWRFQAPADYFHGLIADRLTSVGRAGH